MKIEMLGFHLYDAFGSGSPADWFRAFRAIVEGGIIGMARDDAIQDHGCDESKAIFHVGIITLPRFKKSTK